MSEKPVFKEYKIFAGVNVPPEGMVALRSVIEERARQQIQEDYTPAHDDEHTEGQLALLAALYAMSSRPERIYAIHGLMNELARYGFSYEIKDPIRDLVRAGALILAELERRLRAEGK